SKPDFFHNSFALLLSLTASSVSLFHHHVILCLALPLVLPHTASVSSNRQSFNPFHIDSRSPSSLLSSLYLTLSVKSFRISVSLSLHTLCLLTNFFFIFFTLSCKSILQTNSLCCFTHSSVSMTLMSATFARSHLLTNILSITVLFPPESYVTFLDSLFVNQVFKTTNFIAPANSNNISPSAFLTPKPFPPCTPSYPSTFSPTCPFISPPIITNSSCPISSTILLSDNKNSSFSSIDRPT